MAAKTRKSEQARRLVFLLKEFMNGKSLTTKEIQTKFAEEYPGLTIRTIQRDLILLQDCITELENEKIGRENVWKIPKSLRPTSNLVKVASNELLSMYMLKAHLKSFRGTVIEEQIESLCQKLEELAPGEVYSNRSLYWDQNVGQFDYTQYDDILRKVIRFIRDKKWARITYSSVMSDHEKTYNVFFCRLFSYSGILYVGAYEPIHKHNIALSLQGIVEIEDIEHPHDSIPEFDFQKFTRKRFGVFEGRVKHVTLKVKSEYRNYFINRKWHSTQKEYIDKHGDLIIEMKVPIVPDFVSWILSWHEIITVIKPVELIKEVNLRLRTTLMNYE